MAVMFSSNIFIANSCYIGRNFVVQDQKVIEKKIKSQFHFKLQKLAGNSCWQGQTNHLLTHANDRRQ